MNGYQEPKNLKHVRDVNGISGGERKRNDIFYKTGKHKFC